jgi:hypothetical protein
MLTQSQITLGKLLATENIDIVEKLVPTAYFDVKERTLVLPNWKDIGSALHMRLKAHEVGHARYTEGQGWHDAVVDRGAVFRNYLNVIEDCRIEKLIVREYPGLRRDFAKSTDELKSRGFFGDLDKINSAAFIDRINVHFKMGSRTVVKFSPEESVWVDEIAQLETWEEAEDLTNRLYDWCAEQKQKEQEEQNQGDDSSSESGSDGEPDDMSGDGDFQMEGLESDDGESVDEGEGDDGQSDDGESDNSEAGDEDGQSDDGESKDGGSDDADGQSNDGDGQTDDKGAAASGDDNVGGDKADASLPTPDDAETEKAYRKAMKSLDLGKTVERHKVPDFDLTKFVVPYKDILEKYREEVQLQISHDDRYIAVAKERKTMYNEFCASSKKNVQHMVTEFEMRKAADEYKRTTVSKTGTLDTLKMNNYRFSDDIFRSKTVVAEGKSHGFIMYLDWSGSMGGILRETIEQVLLIANFCRRVGVPFRVYLFGGIASWTNEFYSSRSDELKINMNLFEILNENMSKADFEEMSMYLYSQGIAYTSYSRNHGQHRLTTICLGGTPLTEAILGGIPIANQFMKFTGVQILNTIVLTDGQAKYLKSSKGFLDTFKTEHKLVDPRTRIEYDIEDPNLPKASQNSKEFLAACRMYKDMTGSNMISYHLCKRAPRYALEMQNKVDLSFDYVSTINKELNKIGYANIDVSPFDRTYLIKSTGSSMIDDQDIKVDVGASKAKIKKALIKSRKGLAHHRKILSDMMEAMTS